MNDPQIQVGFWKKKTMMYQTMEKYIIFHPKLTKVQIKVLHAICCYSIGYNKGHADLPESQWKDFYIDKSDRNKAIKELDGIVKKEGQFYSIDWLLIQDRLRKIYAAHKIITSTTPLKSRGENAYKHEGETPSKIGEPPTIEGKFPPSQKEIVRGVGEVESFAEILQRSIGIIPKKASREIPPESGEAKEQAEAENNE